MVSGRLPDENLNQSCSKSNIWEIVYCVFRRFYEQYTINTEAYSINAITLYI